MRAWSIIVIESNHQHVIMAGCLDVVHVIYDTIVFFAILPSMNGTTTSKLIECKEHHAMTFEQWLGKREIPWNFGNFSAFFKNSIPNSQWDSQNPVEILMGNGVFLTNQPYR